MQGAKSVSVLVLLALQAAVRADMLPEGFGGWTLSRGQGVKAADALMAEGDGKSDNAWLSPPVAFEPLAAYCLRFRARGEGASGGTVVAGIPSAIADIGVPGAEWTEYSFVFAVPGAAGRKVEQPVRLGQWEVKGKVFFKDVSVTPVQPVYAMGDGLTLGEGERMAGSTYTFAAPLNTVCRNQSRPLAEATANFHSDRWWLHDGTSFTYRHGLGTRKLRSAQLEITCGYHVSGRVIIEVMKDDFEAVWQQVATLDKVGVAKADLPAALFPADAVRVRVRGEGDKCSLQIYGYRFSAEADGGSLAFTGSTHHVEILKAPQGGGVKVEILEIGDPASAEKGAVTFCVTGIGARDSFRWRLSFQNRDGSIKPHHGGRLPGRARTVTSPFPDLECGDWYMTVNVEDYYEARFQITVPLFYGSGHGARLPSTDDGLALGWAESGWKIPKNRKFFSRLMADALEVRLARNEREATQLVVTPVNDISNVKVSVQGLEGLRAEVLRVGYVPVAQRTDATGVIADWPDPLLPQEGALNVKAGETQPFWIRVFAPKGVRAGMHKGLVIVEADGITENVALNVEVYDFTLPDAMTCETAFGFNPGTVWQYHNIKDEVQKREVLDKYLRTLADHHISPYNPAPMDGWSVSWTGLPPWDGGTIEDGALVVRDASETQSVATAYKGRFDVPGKGLKITFMYRTEQTPDTLLSLNHYRADGSWMSGRNHGTRLPAAAEWTAHEATVTQFPGEAAAFELRFWGAGWQEDGKQTGTTRVKDLSVINLSTGEELIAATAFAPFDAAKAEPVFDWERWDKAVAYAFTNYHFNTVMIGIEGLGGGTFHARSEPEFMGYAEDTPEYHALLSKYLRGIEAHLEEKGWLGKAYIYWFDEPAAKDYAFVMNGNQKLKKYAPKLRRMLTVQVEEALVGGPNLWCPLTPNLNVPLTESRRAAGDRFWWYVCCGPKAPYVTEFIDKPGTEMRLWLWQTWQERVSGILIWETVWWTSNAAYPDPGRPQNPYLDPMSWESGYDAKPGMKSPWGNGDGRFLYPPLVAADGRPAGPVLAAPVTSIRLEMLRDGIEDYEYFVILKKLLAEKKPELPTARYAEYESLLTVPKEVSASLTEFTHDPALMEKHRDRLARAIMELQRLPRLQRHPEY